MLGGVDRAAFAVSFVARLRSRGVPVGFTGIDTLVRALAVTALDSRASLYWAARVTLVRRLDDLATFDAVFAAIFDQAVLALDPNARRQSVRPGPREGEGHAAIPHGAKEEVNGGGLPWATRPKVVAQADASDSPLSVPQRLLGSLAGLTEVAFEQLRPEEILLLAEWLASVARRWPTRASRRFRIDARGTRAALRPTLARARRTGWEPIELVSVGRVDRPRRVVMVCDVSESMQAQTTAYLHLMRALALGGQAEVFAFATTLTRLTPVLAHRSAEVAIDAATARVTDRFGGTRIATNLQRLLSSHHGAAVRGAIVIVASDGWDSDPPEQLAAVMARLSRRAHRVLWINPRVGAPGFEPRVSTMAAALPYCDRLLAAGTFAALGHVIAEIASSAEAPRRRVSPSRR